jgi:hypothetical protein
VPAVFDKYDQCHPIPPFMPYFAPNRRSSPRRAPSAANFRRLFSSFETPGRLAALSQCLCSRPLSSNPQGSASHSEAEVATVRNSLPPLGSVHKSSVFLPPSSNSKVDLTSCDIGSVKTIRRWMLCNDMGRNNHFDSDDE